MAAIKLTPPSLPLNLREHKGAIAIRWTVLVLISCILPIVLFYALWFGTSLKRTIVFAIISAIFGSLSLFQLLTRLVKLTLRNPNYRPIASPRSALDLFEWGFMLGFLLVTIEIAIGTALHSPLIPLLAMPAPTLMFEIAILMLALDALVYAGVALPMRASSVPRGDAARPGVYYILEDIVAVDGGVGLPYRVALDGRYRASEDFRRMLLRLSTFWGVSLLLFAAGFTAIVWTVPWYVAYGLGWGLPFVHSAVMACLTTRYVQWCLRREHESWADKTGVSV